MKKRLFTFLVLSIMIAASIVIAVPVALASDERVIKEKIFVTYEQEKGQEINTTYGITIGYTGGMGFTRQASPKME